jgi:hypothetical protein
VSSTNGHGPKRAILYAGVSTLELAEKGYSLAQQLEALREYAAREGYEVLEEVTDPGQSGASLERPGLDQVRDLARIVEETVPGAHVEYAPDGGHIVVAQRLLQRGADANVKDAKGSVPLHAAADGGHLELVRILLPRTREPQAKNAAGRSALDYARANGYAQIEKLLEGPE